MNKKYYNRQKYYDCQFITLINACIYWDRPFITPYSRQYNKLMKGSGCRYGACIDLSKAYDLLRIKFVYGDINLNWVRNHLPVQFEVFTPHRGYHSILCIGVKGNKLQVTNYTPGRLQTLTWQKIKNMQNKLIYIAQIKVKRKYEKQN